MDDFEFQSLEAVGVALPGAATQRATDAPRVDELERAQAEATAIRAAAHAEGLEQGRAEALAAAQPALAALAVAVEQTHAEALAAAEALELQAATLALAIADKVLGGALDARPQLVVETVRGALRSVVERERVTVLVNPDDLALVQAAMDGLRAELGGIEHCEVQAERRVGRGGAVVRHAHGDVDARLETKLERAREVVFEALATEAAP